MPSVDIDGIRTNYNVLGEGEPLLMYSPGGFDATFDKWSTLSVYARTQLLESLSQKFRCIVFDRRETGHSGGRVERITWDHYVAQGKGLLDHLGIESAHLVGGCMGCCPVTTFATRYPEMVRSMVLYWPVGGAAFRMRGHARFSAHMAFVDQVGLGGVVELAKSSEDGFGKDPRIGPWAAPIRTDPDFASTYVDLDLEDYKLMVNAMSRILLDRDTVPGSEPEDLMRLDVPTLVVPGKDVAHATSAARYLEECIPSAEYWDIPPQEQTENNVPQRLIDFIKNVQA